MAKVMTISGLGAIPRAGAFRAPPGRVIGYEALGRVGPHFIDMQVPAMIRAQQPRASIRGLGSLADFCNDPGGAFMIASGSGVGQALTNYGANVTYGSGSGQTTGDAGFSAAGAGVSAFTNTFNAICTQARAQAAQAAAAGGDPSGASEANALAQIQNLMGQQAQLQQQMALANQQAQAGDTIMGIQKPYFYAGAAVAGLLLLGGAYMAFFRKK